MMRLSAGLLMAVLFTTSLTACSSSPDALSDAFPSSVSEMRQLEAVSYEGITGGRPMKCGISIGRLADGSLLINSGYAPLVVKHVAPDGRVLATHSTGLGDGGHWSDACLTTAMQSGSIAALVGTTSPRLWLVHANGATSGGISLPSIEPTRIRAASDGGFHVIGRYAGSSAVLRLSHALDLEWMTLLEDDVILDVTDASDGRTFVVGHERTSGPTYLQEMKAALISLSNTGEVAAVREYSSRRRARINQIIRLSGDRYLLYGDNEGSGYNHTWVTVVDGAGDRVWDNEEVWDEWYRASLPRRLIAVTEGSNGSLTILSSDLGIDAGSEQKTTVLFGDGRMQDQYEWPAIWGRPAQNAVLDGRSGYVIYERQVGAAMGGWMRFDYTSRLYRLR
jgi:hypothetical protein